MTSKKTPAKAVSKIKPLDEYPLMNPADAGISQHMAATPKKKKS